MKNFTLIVLILNGICSANAQNKLKQIKHPVNSENKILSQISMPGKSRTYSYYNNTWNYNRNNVYTYTNFSDLSTNTSTDTTTGINQNMEQHYYDAGRHDTLTIYSNWNTSTNNWQDYNKSIRRYDSRGNITEEFYYSWDNNSSQLILNNGYKTQYTYDSNNNIIDEIRQEYNNSTMQWNYSYRIIYTYAANAWSDVTIQTWDGTNWVNEERYYNIVWHNFINEEPQSYYNDRWNNNAWDQYQRVNITYTNYDYVEIDDTIQNNVWSNYARYTYTGDQYGSMTNVYAKMISGTWVDQTRYTRTFDSHINETLNSNETFINGNWRIDNGYQYQHTYSGDNLLETIVQYYDNNSLAYVNQFKHIYYDFRSFNNTGLKNISENEVNLFPNPSKDFIKISNNTFIHTIYLYDLTGKEILKLTPNNTIVNIDLNTLDPGTYLYKIISGDKVCSGRFMKL